jgi:transporter family protein
MRGLALVLLAALLWGIGGFLSKLAVASVSPWTAALVRSVVFFPVVAIFVARRAEFRWRLDRTTGYAAVAGLLVGVAIVSVRFALAAFEVSLVEPLRRLSLLVTVGLSVLLLGEALTARKLLGVGAALGAAYLLAP